MTYQIHIHMTNRFECLDSGKNQYPIAEKLEGVEIGTELEFLLNGGHHSFAVVHKIEPPDKSQWKNRWIYHWLPLARTTIKCPICTNGNIKTIRRVPNNNILIKVKECQDCKTQWSTTEIYTGIIYVKKSSIRGGRVESVLLRGKKIRRKKIGLRKTPKGRNRRQ